MMITDDHWIDVQTNGQTLKKKQRSLVRLDVWRKKKARRKVHAPKGPLSWGVRKRRTSATAVTDFAEAEVEYVSDAGSSELSRPWFPAPALANTAMSVSSPQRTNYDPFDVLPISQVEYPGVTKTFSLCKRCASTVEAAFEDPAPGPVLTNVLQSFKVTSQARPVERVQRQTRSKTQRCQPCFHSRYRTQSSLLRCLPMYSIGTI
jgi:hypothetical protein